MYKALITNVITSDTCIKITFSYILILSNRVTILVKIHQTATPTTYRFDVFIACDKYDEQSA